MRTTGANRAAFTLVELLVVIGIISVLISILLPSLSKARQSALRVSCAANLKQIGQGFQLYVNDYRGVLPFGYWSGDANGNGATDWSILTNSEVGGSGLTYADAGTTATSMSRRIFLCPAAIAPSRTAIISQYSVHPRIMPNITDPDFLNGGNYGQPPYLKPYPLSRIQRSAEIAIVFDGSLWDGGSSDGTYFAAANAWRLDAQRWGWSTFLSDDYALDPQPWMTPANSIDLTVGAPVNVDADYNWGNIRFRHMQDTQANVLMADGHVETHNFGGKTPWDTTLLRGSVNVNVIQ